MDNSSIQQKLDSSIKFYSAIATLVAIISDFFSPLFPSSVFFYAILFIFLILFFGIVNDKANYLYKKFLGEWWHLPILKVVSLMLLITGLSYYGTMKNENEGGWLATYFPAIANFQKTFSNIDGNLSDINQKTTIISNSSIEISETTKTLKKEVSENPRKELNNMGIKWSEGEYWGAIVNRDIDVIKLFSSGGMKLRSYPLSSYVDSYYIANLGITWHDDILSNQCSDYINRLAYGFYNDVEEKLIYNKKIILTEICGEESLKKYINNFLAKSYKELNDQKKLTRSVKECLMNIYQNKSEYYLSKGNPLNFTKDTIETAEEHLSLEIFRKTINQSVYNFEDMASSSCKYEHELKSKLIEKIKEKITTIEKFKD